MEATLLCAVNFWLQTRGKDPVSAVLVVEEDKARGSHLDVESMFDLWSSWFKIVQVIYSNPAKNDYHFPSSAHVILHAGGNHRALDAAIKELPKRIAIYRPQFAAPGTWEADASREIAHFDYEIGGKNQWNGAPIKYGEATLRLRSYSHCWQYYPSWAIGNLPRGAKVVDLGSGPLSHLRAGVRRRAIEVIMVDPLLPLYELVVARHGRDPLDIEMLRNGICCLGENLAKHIPPASVDCVYTGNALDHTHDPAAVVQQVRTILKPDGLFVVAVATREGTRQKWDQFHKTDIYPNEEGVPVFQREHGEPQELLAGFKVMTMTSDAALTTITARRIDDPHDRRPSPHAR